MQIPIEIDGKKYVVTDFFEIGGRSYITYEDEDFNYISAYEVEGNQIKILDTPADEKMMIIKELELKNGKI